MKRLTPRLYEAIDRAVNLCSQTLNFVGNPTPALTLSRFALRELVDGAGTELSGESAAPGDGTPRLANAIPDDLAVEADRDQLFRVVSNLLRNAREAGARQVRATASCADDTVRLEIADDGPGMPERARQRLFQPFAGSARKGGTGLGLVIARDIMKAHGGDLVLAETGDGGTSFCVSLPRQRPQGRP